MSRVKQIFTFGFGQLYEGRYCEIWGVSKEACRKRMFEKFGNKWSMQYDNEGQVGVKEFGLKKIN